MCITLDSAHENYMITTYLGNTTKLNHDLVVYCWAVMEVEYGYSRQDKN